MLRVVVPDMQAYDAFYKRLIEAVPLKNVTTRFAMERMKATTLPVWPEGDAGASGREPRRQPLRDRLSVA